MIASFREPSVSLFLLQLGIDMSTHHIASTPVSYSYSFRLTFTIESGRVKLLSAAREEMRAPAPATPPPAKEQSGFWVELRSEKGELLYYRPFRNPLPDSVEVFDDEKGGTIRRVPSTRTEAKFDMIVPDLPAASQLVVHGAARGASRPLITLQMTEMRRNVASQEREIRR
jgi:hypothetical protein